MTPVFNEQGNRALAAGFDQAAVACDHLPRIAGRSGWDISLFVPGWTG